MRTRRVLGGALIGLALATLPFWSYWHWGQQAESHMDHTPRHGGYLAMVGDHHLEVVRRDGHIEVFVSDARRLPLHPHTGWVKPTATRSKQLLRWENQRLFGALPAGSGEIEVTVVLDDGTWLVMSFPELEPAA